MSPTEELIAAVQRDPSFTAPAGHTVYVPKPEGQRALGELFEVFDWAISAAARTAVWLEEEDALSTVYEAFIREVRAHESGKGDFSLRINVVLRRAVSRAERTNDLIRIRERSPALYWKLVHEHGGDTVRAYDECKAGGHGISPDTFLRIHSVLGGVHTLDTLTEDIQSPDPGPEEVAEINDTVRYLFRIISGLQETILRLKFGFLDTATEAHLVNTGIHLGTILTDDEVGGVLNISRAKVQRERKTALASMREAMVESEA